MTALAQLFAAAAGVALPEYSWDRWRRRMSLGAAERLGLRVVAHPGRLLPRSRRLTRSREQARGMRDDARFLASGVEAGRDLAELSRSIGREEDVCRALVSCPDDVLAFVRDPFDESQLVRETGLRAQLIRPGTEGSRPGMASSAADAFVSKLPKHSV